MMVILSEPDEGYSRNASSALHLIYYICFFFILKKLEQFSHLYYILLILQEFSRKQNRTFTYNCFQRIAQVTSLVSTIYDKYNIQCNTRSYIEVS
jgi:hypothetical protein